MFNIKCNAGIINYSHVTAVNIIGCGDEYGTLTAVLPMGDVVLFEGTRKQVEEARDQLFAALIDRSSSGFDFVEFSAAPHFPTEPPFNYCGEEAIG